MQTIASILPVFVMLGLGAFCRKMKFVSQKGVNDIKFIVTRIILPVAVFNALATAEYSSSTWISIGIMFVMMVTSFGMGFLLKPLNKGDYQLYTPFMVSIYEGGMIGYPLFISLCGEENLSQIAIIDIAGLLFGFSIYMGLLEQVQDGGKIDVKRLFTDALKNPTFIAAATGVIIGMTGLVKLLVASSAGPIYTESVSMITKSLSPMILLVVGYDLSPDMNTLSSALKTIGLRLALQAVCCVAVICCFNAVLGADMIRNLAVICYMSSPATFSMQSFMKDEKSSHYVATTNSLYCIVSVAVYVVLTVIS